MRTTLAAALIFSSLLGPYTVFAAPPVTTPKSNVSAGQSVKPEPLKTITLYTLPKKTSAVCATLNSATHIIPIFYQGEWVKVGNPSDGKVGWINIADYRQLLSQRAQPTVRSVFMQSEARDHNPPKLNIIAYSNGKQLSNAEALALYQDMQKQAEQQWLAMEQLQQTLFNSHSLWPSEIMRPIIIITQPMRAAPSAAKPPVVTSTKK